MKAVWRGSVIAESEQTITVENNPYFPPRAVNKDYLRESATHTRCPWKGQARYFHVKVGDHVNKDAAWYYPDPKPAARQLAGMVAFRHGVQITD